MVIFKIYGHLCSKGLSLNITRDCRNYVFLHAECLKDLMSDHQKLKTVKINVMAFDLKLVED